MGVKPHLLPARAGHCHAELETVGASVVDETDCPEHRDRHVGTPPGLNDLPAALPSRRRALPSSPDAQDDHGSDEEESGHQQRRAEDDEEKCRRSNQDPAERAPRQFQPALEPV